MSSATSIEEPQASYVAATMNQPLIFDGRNCLQRDVMRELCFQYYPIGRPAVENMLRLKNRV